MNFNTGIIIGVIVGIIVTNLFSLYKKKCLLGNEYVVKVIKSLLRQSARWTIAARQDENPLIAVLHANYGAAYLWALKDNFTTDMIEEASGIDIKRFKKDIVETQDNVTRKMSAQCPGFAPPRTYLTEISGEG